MTILVTGGTGTVGGWVVNHLIGAGHDIRVMSRNPDKANLPNGVEAVEGTMADVGSFAAALEGVTAAHLIAFSDGYSAVENGQETVTALEEAGVERCTVLDSWDDTTTAAGTRSSPFFLDTPCSGRVHV